MIYDQPLATVSKAGYRGSIFYKNFTISYFQSHCPIRVTSLFSQVFFAAIYEPAHRTISK